MTRLEFMVDVHPSIHPTPSVRSAGCGDRDSLAVPHPQQEGEGGGRVDRLRSSSPSTFHLSGRGIWPQHPEPGERGASGLMPDPNLNAVHREDPTMARIGTAPRGHRGALCSTRLIDRTMTNPGFLGEVSPPCLGLSGGPWWPINIPPPADAGRGTR